MPRLGSLTQRQCVMLCDLTGCYAIESPWLQRLILTCDEVVSNSAFNVDLRLYTMANAFGRLTGTIISGMGLHSSTYQLNLSRFCECTSRTCL